jgi:hypothetical protein
VPIRETLHFQTGEMAPQLIVSFQSSTINHLPTMKTNTHTIHTLIAAGVLTCLFLIAACGDSTTNTPNPGGVNPSNTASGSMTSAGRISGTFPFQSGGVGINGSQMSIGLFGRANNADSVIAAIGINALTTGTYEWSSQGNSGSFIFTVGGQRRPYFTPSARGSFVLTRVEANVGGTVEGTFSGTVFNSGSDSLNITGSFSGRVTTRQ